MPLSQSAAPTREMEVMEIRTRGLLVGRLGLDWRDRMWAWRQHDLARWAQGADERDAAVAAERFFGG